MPSLPNLPFVTLRKTFLKSAVLLGLLLFAHTATAGDLCVNYLSEVSFRPRQWSFTSFNPRTKESVVVASIDSPPYEVKWDKNFAALTYTAAGGTYRLNWKKAAAPTRISRKVQTLSVPDKPPQLGKVWDADGPGSSFDAPGSHFDAPAHRKIDVGFVEGCNYGHFGTPATWENTETGEKKVLYDEADGDYLNGTTQLQISTADSFILMSVEYVGNDAILADMNTGEIVLKAGTPEHRSMAVGWGQCPSVASDLRLPKATEKNR
ncbi:MAG TPA: hypothetical protein VN634_02500 [Candidatus Limnocylindrales bacterium]|nr:hypothetical protein [Candidatus Limnocylindrales bacterium]